MSRVIESFIDDVCSYIKYKGVHKEVKDELSLHIDELKDSYISKGLSEEEAEKKAIADMGNAAEIGEKLNKQHKPQTEWSLIILTAIISFFGILVMYVSSNFENHPVSFSNYILHVCVGVAALIGIYFTDYIKLKKHPIMLYFAAVFLLVFCMFFGTAYAGVKRWLVVGGFAISVNSVAGILFVSSFCGFLEKYQGEGFMGIVKLMLWGIGSMMLFVLQPSMSMVFVLFVAYAVLVIRAISLNHFDGNKKIQMKFVLSLGGISALMSLGVLISSPYRFQRLLAFWNNGANDPAGSGWIFAMADKVLKSSNLVGKGTPLTEGSIDWVMPEITTDFALINVINNFGWLVGIALVAIIAFFIVKMFITSNKIKNSFGFYLSLVSCVMLTVQFVINVLINFGLCPYIDVSLPFISYGGTNYLTNMIYVGLILSAWRRNNILSRTQRNISIREKLITFADNKLIIDFGVSNTKSHGHDK
ncbi:MAG: FtsW/RodA/SpoVE family cell cycle protein [Ruminococcaceae bacterium]|nr:FtsW/RodA/SpoVE family cell cycle protein [Oscillospiraceae bacterium]